LKCIYVSYVFSGIDFIVSLHIHEDEHVRNLSVKVIEYIGDITPAEVSQRHNKQYLPTIMSQLKKIKIKLINLKGAGKTEGRNRTRAHGVPRKQSGPSCQSGGRGIHR
jgi:hypothetical protein